MTISLKVPFGMAKFSKMKNVRYLSWEDAFDVEFEDGPLHIGAAVNHSPRK